MNGLRMLLLICALVAVADLGGEPKTLSIADAKRLVYEALPDQTRSLPGLSLEPGKVESDGRCVTFDVLWSNPGPGSVHVNFYTVDLQNATLWRGVMPKLVVGPRVARLQRDLRKGLGIGDRISPRAIQQSPCWK